MSLIRSSPETSVVIPTYNRADDLRRCLLSLKSQTDQNFEVIICDDGSTDNTKLVVNDFSNSLHIIYLKLTNFGGPARPRNRGVTAARGKYIAFLDSDDWWCAEKIEKSLNFLDAGYDIVYHDLFLMDESNLNSKKRPRLLKTRDLKPPIFDNLLLNGNAINLSSVVVRKNKFQEIVGFSEDKNLIAGEDFEAWIRLAKITNRFKRIKEPLGFYWAGGGNISEPRRTIKFMSSIKSVHAVALKKKATLISYQLARAHLECGDLDLARKNILDALSGKPFSIIFFKAMVTLAQVYLAQR